MASGVGGPSLDLSRRLADGVESMEAVGRVFAAMIRASGKVPQVSVVLGPAAGADLDDAPDCDGSYRGERSEGRADEGRPPIS
jgi:hypothetical protein